MIMKMKMIMKMNMKMKVIGNIDSAQMAGMTCRLYVYIVGLFLVSVRVCVFDAAYVLTSVYMLLYSSV